MEKDVGKEIINKLKLLVIQVNRQCNLRCIFCCNKDGNKSISLRVDKVKKLIKTFPNLEELILTGGESLLFMEYVFEIIEFTKKLNKKIKIQVNTTGIIMTDKILERLKKSTDVIHTSVNTLKPEVFGQIKRGDPIFIDVINKNIRKYVEAGFYVIVDNAVAKYNVDEVLDIYKKCEEMGVQEYAVSQMIINGRATKEMLADYPTFEKMIIKLIKYHEKRVKAGSKMHLELWCFYSNKLKKYRDSAVRSEIPNTSSTSCCCGSSMLYVSAEGYIMPCSLAFDHNDFKDCDINKKNVKEILNKKPIFKLINKDVSKCLNNGVCKLFNPKIKGTFYD